MKLGGLLLLERFRGSLLSFLQGNLSKRNRLATAAFRFRTAIRAREIRRLLHRLLRMQRLLLISGPLCRRRGSGSRRGRLGRNLRVQFRSGEAGRWHFPSLRRRVLPGILVRFNLRRLSLSEQIVLKPVSLPPREPRSLTEARLISIPGEIVGIQGNCMGLHHELFPVIRSPASFAVKSHPGPGQEGHQKEGEDETGCRRPHHTPTSPADAALAGALPDN